jgi:uncharacterized protein DUF6152
MSKVLWTLVVACALFALSVGRSEAHHAFSAVYDGNQTITVEGVVTQFRFVNPHAMMSLDVTDKSGKVEKWTVEFAGRLNLIEGGWTSETIKPGDHIKVSGNPARKGDRQMAFRRIVKADGTELLPTQAKRLTAIEEERRERARQREQGK